MVVCKEISCLLLVVYLNIFILFQIFEIFGPVLHPFYVLRFNSSEHIKAKGINVQDGMYFAPSVEDFTQYIFAEKLKQWVWLFMFFP